MIKKVEVIGLPGQGKSTLIGNYLKSEKRQENNFFIFGFLNLIGYLFFWTKVLFFGKIKDISKKKYFKIILKRGLDSFTSSKKLVDEGSLQNFLSFFEYFNSAQKISDSIKNKLLPKVVIVVQINNQEESIRMSSLKLEKRRGLDKGRAEEVSIKMKKILDELVLVLKEKGVKVFYVDSFSPNSLESFNKYLNENNF